MNEADLIEPAGWKNESVTLCLHVFRFLNGFIK